MKTLNKCYSELILLPTFEERFEYLKLNGSVGEATFGYDRWLNQQFYRSAKWKRIRDQVIVRDNGCDLGIDGKIVYGSILIHHMNPIRPEDILNESDLLINPEFLICVSPLTHKAIHYSDANLLPKDFVERKPNDTCPWRI